MTSHCGSLWRKCLLILLVLLQIQTLASAQFDSLRMRRDVFRFADGVIHTLSSPVRWDGKDLATLGALVAGTTAVSRLYSDSHWISDIAFGGMLAWFCADTAMTRIQMNRFRGVRRESNTLVWKVYPYPGGLTLRAAIQ